MADIADRVSEVLEAASLLLAISVVIFDIARRSAEVELDSEIPDDAKPIARGNQRKRVARLAASRTLPAFAIVAGMAYSLAPIAVSVFEAGRISLWGFDELVSLFSFAFIAISGAALWLLWVNILLGRKWWRLR